MSENSIGAQNLKIGRRVTLTMLFEGGVGVACHPWAKTYYNQSIRHRPI